MLILVERCGTAQCITVGCIMRSPAHGDPCPPPPPPSPQQAREQQNWTREQWTKVTLSAESHFYMCAAYLGSARHHNKQEGSRRRQFAAFGALIHVDATLDVSPTRWCRWGTLNNSYQASVGCAGQTGSIQNGVHVSMGQGCPGRWSPCYVSMFL